MSASVAKLTKQALDLSESERAELAHRLLLSLEEVAEEGVVEAWDQEIATRVRRIKNCTAKGRRAEDVPGDLRARLR
jgi:hypothetical protein